MKYIFAILFISVLAFSNSSCQKEFFLDDIDSSLITDPIPPGGLNGNFTANIEGTKFIADKGAAATRSMGVIVIGGFNNAGENITIRVADSGVHVYTLDIGSMTNIGTYTKENENTYTTNAGNEPQQSGGTLSITSIDTDKKTLSGKFSMNVYRQIDNKQKKITEGIFKDVSYETQPIPPANTTDTFRVQIDGTAFPAYSIVGLNLMNTISIIVNNQEGSKTVGLTMPSDVKAGTYNYSLAAMDFFGQYNPTSGTFLVANSGSLTILEHNTATKRIKGNFNFEAKDLMGSGKASLTEGYFSVTYK